MSDIDAEMNVIADMLQAGHSIDYMAIRDPERLNEILTERGVDLGNQAYVNEAGEYCVVDDLDSIWRVDNSGVIDAQASYAVPKIAKDEFVPTPAEQSFIDEKRRSLHDALDAKRAEYDESAMQDGVYNVLADSMHPDFRTGARYVSQVLESHEKDIVRYVDKELADFPSDFIDSFKEEQISHLQSELAFYYDVTERYEALKTETNAQDLINEFISPELDRAVDNMYKEDDRLKAIPIPQAKGIGNDFNM